jgi:hypothetical protein
MVVAECRSDLVKYLQFLGKLASAIYPMERPIQYHRIKTTFLFTFGTFFDKKSRNFQRTDNIFLLGIPVYILLTYICSTANTNESSNMLESKRVGHSSTPERTS